MDILTQNDMILQQERLQELSCKAHANACVHGWHDEKMSDEHWLCMIITEVAEAVEADRKNKRAQRIEFGKKMNTFRQKEVTHFDVTWISLFEKYIKDSLEDEFADICIRIFDYAFEKFGDEMLWFDNEIRVRTDLPFTEIAYHFMKYTLNSGMLNISESITFMFQWAESLNIDLFWHIEAKMMYNESRPYRHDQKKY